MDPCDILYMGQRTGYMYLDGEIDWSGQKDSPTFRKSILGARNGGEQGCGLIDEVAVWKRALSQDEIKKLVSGNRPYDGDFNGNGMGDEWEEQYSITDPDADLDGDGLSNVQEFQKGTDPSKEDTDGDGLKDSVETKTGTFVSATDTGTDPLKVDTDGGRFS